MAKKHFQWALKFIKYFANNSSILFVFALTSGNSEKPKIAQNKYRNSEISSKISFLLPKMRDTTSNEKVDWLLQLRKTNELISSNLKKWKGHMSFIDFFVLFRELDSIPFGMTLFFLFH